MALSFFFFLKIDFPAYIESEYSSTQDDTRDTGLQTCPTHLSHSGLPTKKPDILDPKEHQKKSSDLPLSSPAETSQSIASPLISWTPVSPEPLGPTVSASPSTSVRH